MRHPEFVSIVVALAFFQSSLCQPCNPELDYSIYFNGTSFFTVSSSNGTCYCDSYVSSGASVFYGGVGQPGGQTTINSELLVDDSATFSSGITVAGSSALGPTTLAAASVQGTLSVLGPVSAAGNVTVAAAVNAASFAGDGSALTNLDLQPDVAAISAQLISAMAVIANQTSLIAAQASLIDTQASQISTQSSQISAQGLQIASLQANATAQAAQITTLINRVNSNNATLTTHTATLTSYGDTLTTQAGQIAGVQGVTLGLSTLSSALTTNLCSEFNSDELNNNQMFVNNTFVTIGGGLLAKNLGGPEGTNIVEYFNPLCNQWRTGPSSIYNHRFPAVTYANGEIYVLAGFDGYSFPTSVGCEKFNIKNNTWIDLPPLYVGRQAAAAAAIGTDIYVIGGRTSQSVGQSTYNNKYNGTGVWYNMTGNNYERRGAVAVSLSGFIYLFGGANTIYVLTSEKYNPSTDTWSIVRSMPDGRNSFAGCLFNNMVWILGGNSAGGGPALQTALIYIPQNDTWAYGPPLLQVRQEHACGVVNNELIVAGGTNSTAPASQPWPLQATVEKYSPVSNTWTSQAPIIMGRSGLGGIGVGPY